MLSFLSLFIHVFADIGVAMDEWHANNFNVSEGHLGGYIMSRSEPAPSGLDIENSDPETWHPELWLWAMSALNIRSVLDVGCGEGHAARFFKTHGCDVVGVDGSRRAQQDSKIPEQHVLHDFTNGPWLPQQACELVWSSEFVEHVEEKFCDNFLATFSTATRFVFMTFAGPDQPGWHHVNCQPQGYWEEKLENVGFFLDEKLTGHARLVAKNGHFARAGLVFRPASDISFI